MKKVICIIISFAFLNTISFATYTDINKHWASGYISRFTNNEYINGYEDNSFRPDNNIKWNEFLKIIVKIMDTDILENSTFWDKPYIEYGKKMSLISSESIDYNQYITRKDVVNILYNFLNYYAVINDKSINESEFLIKNNILYGYTDNTLRLENNITRAEVVALLARAIDYRDSVIYTTKISNNFFNNKEIYNYTNYKSEDSIFLNTYSLKNNKVYYSDLGRYDVYDNISIEKYNDTVINVLKELINKDTYVLNTYIKENKCIIIAYGIKEKYVDNGSTLFEIMLFEEKQKGVDFEYNVKISIHKLWKELDEIKRGIAYNKYYILKLENILNVFLPKNETLKLISTIPSNHNYSNCTNYVYEKEGVNSNIFLKI